MRVISALSLFLALTVGANADGCVPTTSDPELTFPGESGGTRYIDNDACQLPPDGTTDPNDLIDWFTPYGGYHGDPNGGPCILSLWSYMESNDIPGLQRGDIAHDDTCGGMIQMDSLNPY